MDGGGAEDFGEYEVVFSTLATTKAKRTNRRASYGTENRGGV